MLKALTVLVLVIASTPAVAHAATDPSPMLTAMRRDLNLTEAQARARITSDAAAAVTEQALRRELGHAFGGAWTTGDRLVVAITDPHHTERVKAAGAEPVLVARSEARLREIKSKLDRSEHPPARSVPAWYVDVTTNSVVVLARPGGQEAAARFAAVDPDAVRVETSAHQLRPLQELFGGQAYYTNGFGRCSVGFPVIGWSGGFTVWGFATAGHCGTAGSTTTGFDSAAQGTVQRATFPGSDHGWVAVHWSWRPRPLVTDYAGGHVAVAGSQEAPVGAAVCRSGSTTGWRCGTIQAKDVTVNYLQGQVNGLTLTSACADFGDSGGSWVSGTQAQGVTSGGSGNCVDGGVTVFQPVNPILQAYGLRLVTDPFLSYFQCGNFGAGSYGCTAEADRASNPQIRWTVNGAPMPAFDNQLMIYGGCEIGRLVTIRITLSSANGSVAEQYPVWCSGTADG